MLLVSEMNVEAQFQSLRLTGHAPRPSSLSLYERLFGANAERDLTRDIETWLRCGIAPWTLRHAGHEAGVAGFRPVDTEPALEVIFHFVPEVRGQGLASEFLSQAIDYAQLNFGNLALIGCVDQRDQIADRVMHKAGFRPSGEIRNGNMVMRLD